jgi:hypothetical protein
MILQAAYRIESGHWPPNGARHPEQLPNHRYAACERPENYMVLRQPGSYLLNAAYTGITGQSSLELLRDFCQSVPIRVCAKDALRLLCTLCLGLT